MPRHLIGDAHEWINEIPTVPTHSLVKLQPSQRSWVYSCVPVNLESFSLFLCSQGSWNWGNLRCHNYTSNGLSCGLSIATENLLRWGFLVLWFQSAVGPVNNPVCATAGQEDPFELDSNLLLSSGRHGEDRKRQYLRVRPWNTATWRFGWLTVS